MIEVLCEDCREAYPSNQTRVITESRISSRRQTTRMYRGTRGGIGFGGSSGVTTSYRDRTVCLDCLHYRAEAIRRENRARMLRWLFAISIGIGVFLWASSHHVLSVPGPASNPAYAGDAQTNLSISDTPAATPVDVVDTPTANSDAAAPSDDETPSSDNEPNDVTTSDRDRLPPDAAPTPVRTEQDEMNSQGSREIGQAIDDATRVALQSGATAKWHKNGQKGYVVVSGPTVNGEKTCRSVAWTDNISRSDNVTCVRQTAANGHRNISPFDRWTAHAQINHSDRFNAGQPLRNSHTLEMTTDPSPTDDATRLTDPARTSPTAKMPGCDVA